MYVYIHILKNLVDDPVRSRGLSFTGGFIPPNSGELNSRKAVTKIYKKITSKSKSQSYVIHFYQTYFCQIKIFDFQ